MRLFKILLLVTLTLSMNSLFAKVHVKQLELDKNANSGKLLIKYSGMLTDYPVLKISGKFAYIDIPNSYVTSMINKQVSFSTEGQDTNLKAAQYNKKTTRVKILFPFLLKKYEDRVALTIRDGVIEMSFPRIKVQSNTAAKTKNIAKVAPIAAPAKKLKAVAKKSATDVLDEKYLAKLESDFRGTEKKKKVQNGSKKEQNDSVSTTLSSLKNSMKKPKSSFSMVGYAGKFVAFLGFVLLMFYGIVTLFKKGVIKKGKLGFLNNTDQVTVLSQTHIAPKKTLMLIKAHKQTFLVSNTDAGIQLISEVNDTSGLLKDGERLVAGNNFDDSVDSASSLENIESKIKLKDDITQSSDSNLAALISSASEKVKFSDQLKKKVKDIKPLNYS